MEMQTEDNGPKNELMTIQIVNFVGLILKWYWSVRKLDIGIKTDENC